MAKVRANEFRGESEVSEHIGKLDRIPKFQRSKTGPDVLYSVSYNLEGGQTCDGCRTYHHEDRQPLDGGNGVSLRDDRVRKPGHEKCGKRDKVNAKLGGVLCFEMEAAGLMHNFQCLTIRSICDCADSQKNKRCHPYAADIAAAYAKEALSVIPPTNVETTQTFGKAIQSLSN